MELARLGNTGEFKNLFRTVQRIFVRKTAFRHCVPILTDCHKVHGIYLAQGMGYKI
jgi:hypothetical protein